MTFGSGIMLVETAQSPKASTNNDGVALSSICQLNRIESEWLRIKEDEIAGQIFEDEYDLAIAVMASVEVRAHKKGYRVESSRFQKDSSTS